MNDRNSLETILNALRERDVPFDKDVVEAELRKDSVMAWVDEYLGEETLLTKEELALYNALEKSGEFQSLQAAHDVSLIHATSDQEIQLAIEELKRSTASIEKQTETLRSQQDGMSKLVKANKADKDTRSRMNEMQQRKWASENSQISSALDELAETLKQHIADYEQQAKVMDAGLAQTANDFLRADDKLLLSLQKLAGDLEPIRTDDEEAVERVKSLCTRLIKHTVEAVRTRLDRIYLEASGGDTSPKDDDLSNSEIIALQEELESLYSEIIPVAQMSIEQQYLEPALKVIATQDEHGKDRAAKAMDYIHKCIVFLSGRLQTLASRAQEYKCHRAATTSVVTAIKDELAAMEALSSSPTRTPSSRTLQRSSTDLSVRRNVPRRSSMGYEDEADAAQQLLRSLGISLPADISDPKVIVTSLEATSVERSERLKNHMQSTEKAFESTILSGLKDAHETLQLLDDCLMEDTLYGNVRLLDADSEELMDVLDQSVQEVQALFGEVNLELLHGKNPERERFVNRWRR